MEWSPQQKQALETVQRWYKSGNNQVCRVFGFAGTGKTTLARFFADMIKGQTIYGAYTGKASLVMRKSGCNGAVTIHSMIYMPQINHKTKTVEFILDEENGPSNYDLIVIDECSMVNEEVGKDLLSFGVPILVLGDPAQLPPVKGGGFFTEQDPDAMLTEIHRQAEGNPIVKLATDVREGRALDCGIYGESKIIRSSDLVAGEMSGADQVLVGTNRTRKSLNDKFRKNLGMNGLRPVSGDRLVCLQNDKMVKIFNGGLFTVIDRDDYVEDRKHCMELTLSSDDYPNRGEIEAIVRRECFEGGLSDVPWKYQLGTQKFDYGYALTVHKSQGSQWDDVMLFDESGAFRDNAQRWLYTGITRAAKRITIVR